MYGRFDLGATRVPAPQDLADEAQAIVRHRMAERRITLCDCRAGRLWISVARMTLLKLAGASWGTPAMYGPGGLKRRSSLTRGPSLRLLEESRRMPSCRRAVIPCSPRFWITRISGLLSAKWRDHRRRNAGAFDLTTWPDAVTHPCLRCAWDPGVPTVMCTILPASSGAPAYLHSAASRDASEWFLALTNQDLARLQESSGHAIHRCDRDDCVGRHPVAELGTRRWDGCGPLGAGHASYGACLLRTFFSVSLRSGSECRPEKDWDTGATFLGGAEAPTPAKVREK